MNLITYNPYRIIGVFANDPLRMRTANIGKISAYSKIGKSIYFGVDAERILGPVSRSNDDLISANAKLTRKEDESLYSFFWFHTNSLTDIDVIANLSFTNVSKFIKEQLSLSEFSGFINAAVASLAIEDYGTAAKCYNEIIESGGLLDDFREEHDLSKKTINNKELIKKLISCLSDDFRDVDWWPLFLSVSHKQKVLEYIKSIFEEIAIVRINTTIENNKNNKNLSDKDLLKSAKLLYRSLIPQIRVLDPIDEFEGKTPEAQIVLDKLSNLLISECKKYYSFSKYENEQSVLPTIQLARHALSLACNNETIELAKSFIGELEEDVSLLPPKEISKEANIIQNEIRLYCEKPDEIRWSLLLVKNCILPLQTIKKSLGRKNPYYLSISVKIADNALYNSEAEIQETAKFKNTNVNTHAKYIEVLKQAWKLHLNLLKLDLESSFKNGKLKENGENIESRLKNENVFYKDIIADVTLDTEDDVFEKCNDYKSLVHFCELYPDSPHFSEAMRRIWKFEDEAYPKEITTRNLYLYKELYPKTHNDQKLLEDLDKLLFVSKGSIQDYKTLLRLFPNHHKKDEAIRRIDYLTFSQCKTIQQYKQYLSEFSNGLYRNQAERKIDDISFSKCKTATEFNQYIINFPKGVHTQEALDKIEDHIYDLSCKSNDFDKYLKQYPNGKYSSQLRSRIEYDIYNKCSSRSDYEEYIKKFPRGQYVDLAQKALKRKRSNSLAITVGGVIAAFLLLGLFIFKQSDSTPSSLSNQTVTESSTSNLYEPTDDVNSDNTNEYESEDTSISPEESIEEPAYTDAPSEQELYGDNHLKTGSKPYSSYFGKAKTGNNYIKFNTSGYNDYVIIVKRSSDSKYVNHIYIKGGENATLYLPDGHYYIYFYSGKGWNPNKVKGNLTGGFVSNESEQKDGPVDLFSAWGEYTLYPVQNGNLTLQAASSDEMFN